MADLKTKLGETLIGKDLRQEMAALREEARVANANGDLLQERLAELELALEDANWMRLMMDGEQEFSRDGIRRIAELARVMVIKNPLIKRQVLVQALYVWSQGVTVRAKDPVINEVLQRFWDDEKNKSELTSHEARMLKEIDMQVEGNVFFVLFTRPTDGRVRVRSIFPDEIERVVTDPEDAKSPWFYLRVWKETRLNPATGRIRSTQRKAYYPDWRYHPKNKPDKIGDVDVKWDSPVYHKKTGGLSGWKFGLSEVYASIDWARAYKEFLEDVASLMRSYSRFAWRLTYKGGSKKALAAAKARLNSTLGEGGSGAETNPAPTAGSTFVGSDQYDLQPLNLRGATISPEDGRRLLLMCAAAAGLPETYYGDVSVGTLATAKSMDRPTELMMRNRQVMWTDVLRDILSYMILQAMKATNKNKIRKLGAVRKVPDGEEIEERIEWNEGVNATLDVDFPPILERDVQAAIQSIVTAATMNGQQIAIFDEPTVARLLLTALAQDDVDEIMAQLYPDETSSVASPETPSEAQLRAAFMKVLEALERR